MATIINGLMGGISGRIGNVVGVARNGSFYLRSRPARVKNPRTKEQTAQRSRFSVTMAFLKTCAPLLRVGFRSEALGMKSAFNAAMSYNMQHAVEDGQWGLEIDFPNVLVSKGTLPTSPMVYAAIVNGELCVRWDDSPEKKAGSNDEVVMLAYNPARQRAIYDLHAGKRKHNESSLLLPSQWQDDAVETYISFMSADASRVSDSLYVGRHHIYRVPS